MLLLVYFDFEKLTVAFISVVSVLLNCNILLID